jgi:AcrR family transcriptional regulator
MCAGKNFHSSGFPCLGSQFSPARRHTMFDQIEAHFAGTARTPKGERAMRAIFQATRITLAEKGLHGTSLDLIAAKAGLTQAALRHYLPTRDDLLTAFFAAATELFQSRMTEVLAGSGMHAREVLERCVTWHLEFMEAVDTAIWLDCSSYWLRHRQSRRMRDDWYSWLMGQYAALIGQIQPSVGVRERQRRAYAIHTLVLGAWVTHGRGSAMDRNANVPERRRLLIDVAIDIALQ